MPLRVLWLCCSRYVLYFVIYLQNLPGDRRKKGKDPQGTSNWSIKEGELALLCASTPNHCRTETVILSVIVKESKLISYIHLNVLLLERSTIKLV